MTINFPGLQGGANWGGASFDPTRGYLFVNTLDMGQVTSLVDSDGPLPVARGPVSGRFYEPSSRLMCQQPPWGRLTAVTCTAARSSWQSVLGVSDNLPEDIQRTGRPNVGGSIATAGGLVFIGATDDNRFRAFDAASGTRALDSEARRRGARDADHLSRQERQTVRRGDCNRRQFPGQSCLGRFDRRVRVGHCAQVGRSALGCRPRHTGSAAAWVATSSAWCSHAAGRDRSGPRSPDS